MTLISDFPFNCLLKCCRDVCGSTHFAQKQEVSQDTFVFLNQHMA